MISDIKVDFSVIKKVLHKEIEQKATLLTSDENTVLNELLNNYQPKSDIEDKNLYQYKKQFNDYYSDKCKKLSRYNSEKITNSDRRKINELENEGKIFISGVFIDLIRHLRIEQALLNIDNQIDIEILESLNAHLGNKFYYEVNSTTLSQLFNNAIYMHLSDNHKWGMKDIETLGIIKSMKRLMNTNSLDYELMYGEIILSNDSNLRVQRKLENMISAFGGIEFLKKLFFDKIKPKYNKQIDRFMLHRGKQQLMSNIKELRLPYNYLIQLVVKYINSIKLVVLTPVGNDKLFNDIIQISSDYLNVLNLQPYSIFGDMIYDFKSIPIHLSKNIAFEKMFTPNQYRPDFVCEFLDKAYIPLSKDIKLQGYTMREYLTFSKTILADTRTCVLHSTEELKRKTKINYTSLVNILNDASFKCNTVNSAFFSFMGETNYYKRPLIKMKDDTYFLFSSYFNGFSFCEIIYHKLKITDHITLDKDKGFIIENMIKAFFNSKNYSYHFGKYSVKKGQTYECDLVIENDKNIVFFEIKNRPLPDTFEQGDDIKTLRCLAEGMIKAQIQCSRHEFYLKKNGKIILSDFNTADPTDTYQLDWNNRRVISVSVCSQEYFFLTNKNFSEKLLESLLSVSYHTNDKSRENELTKLNKLSDELKKIIADMYKNAPNLKQVFFNTLFRSAQQLYSILNASNVLNDFINNLTEPIHIVDGSDDVYCQLLNSMKMRAY